MWIIEVRTVWLGVVMLVVGADLFFDALQVLGGISAGHDCGKRALRQPDIHERAKRPLKPYKHLLLDQLCGPMQRSIFRVAGRQSGFQPEHGCGRGCACVTPDQRAVP